MTKAVEKQVKLASVPCVKFLDPHTLLSEAGSCLVTHRPCLSLVISLQANAALLKFAKKTAPDACEIPVKKSEKQGLSNPLQWPLYIRYDDENMGC